MEAFGPSLGSKGPSLGEVAQAAGWLGSRSLSAHLGVNQHKQMP